MNLIIETDIGHDPDDFFAISYLAAAGVDIRAILISPGDPDQIAIARFLCKEIGINIPIGASKLDRAKLSSGSIHHDFLKKYHYPLEEKADDLGSEIIKSVISEFPDSELFVIGPVSSVGKYINENPAVSFRRATMQGGFLPYSLHMPKSPKQDFIDKHWVPTFNLNGDRPNALNYLNANIGKRQMVGKNICHTVFFDRETFSTWNPKEAKNKDAARLFGEAAELYFARHENKKFHDPTAACLHLHPEIGTWYNGKTTKMESGWTTVPDPSGDSILADVDYDLLWDHLMSCT